MQTTEELPIAPLSLVPSGPTHAWFMWDRLPVVLDASTLIGDCLRMGQRQQEPLLLGLSRGLPLASLYATESVRQEVDEHLIQVAEQKLRLPPECVKRVEVAWHKHYEPTVSFVDLDPLPSYDPRLANLEAADLDDLPTGSLAELLSPCLVFSSDHHLRKAGIARNDWGNLMTQALEVGKFQAGQSGTFFVVFLAGSIGVEIGSGIIGAARRAPLPALLIGAGAGCLLYRYWTSECGRGHRGELRDFVSDASSRVGPFVSRALESQQLLERAAYIPDRAPSELAIVARVVASAPHPLRATEIAYHVGFSRQKAAALLRNPIFTRTSEGSYLLGRPGERR